MKCENCGKETYFSGFDPFTKKELCIECYNKIMIEDAKRSERKGKFEPSS
jgi:hypothetical protein